MCPAFVMGTQAQKGDHMYEGEDVYTRLRMSASGGVEVLTVDADHQVTAVVVEDREIPYFGEV